MQFSFHDVRIAASNIPSHNVQSHIYQQSQPQFVSGYLPHMGPGGNFYQLATSPMYFGNFSASVNVHGAYTQTAMQPQQYIQSFVPTDNHQSSVEQSTHPIQSQPPNHFPGSRRPRRSEQRGRSFRREYSTRQMNSVQEINSAQSPAHAIESPAMIQQSSNFNPYYIPYMPYPNHFAIGPHSTTAAQHAAGPPLYPFGFPHYPGIITYPAVMPVDYVLDEKSDDGMGVSKMDTIILN